VDVLGCENQEDKLGEVGDSRNGKALLELCVARGEETVDDPVDYRVNL
jgi:hypothetical protein